MDCDDDVTPEYCKVLYEKAVRDGNDLVVCKVEHIEYKGTGVKRTVSGTSLFDFDNYKLSEHPQILTELSTGPWNKLIARELFFRIQFAEDNCFAEDFLYSIQAFCLAKNIGTLAEPLYHYYHTHGGVTSRFSAVQLEWPKTMRNICSFLRDNDLQGAYLAEVEIKLLEFCFSLNSRAVRMYNQDWRLRAEFIRVMYAFIHQEFPDWRKNCYYVERCKKVLLNKAASPRYDYGKRHLLFLIYLSRFFPDRCVPFILRVDRKLFVQVKYLRWKLHDWFRK